MKKQMALGAVAATACAGIVAVSSAASEQVGFGQKGSGCRDDFYGEIAKTRSRSRGDRLGISSEPAFPDARDCQRRSRMVV